VQHAVAPALTGDRAFQREFVGELARRAAITTTRLSALPGVHCVAPRAAFYAMPQVSLPPGTTDEDFVLGLLRAKGILCVYGSGFGLAPADGFLRIVFLAPPDDLEQIYDDVAAFTAEFRANPAPAASQATGALS
jgi:alanine-synthesizing transaminase